MALKDKIHEDMKAALLGGDRFAGDTLRNLKAAVLNEEVAQGRRDGGLTDPDIEKVIAREVKKRHESASVYEVNGRQDLAEVELREAKVLSAYLPKQISEADLRIVVQSKIDETGAEGPQAMGQIIGLVKKQLGNSVDGSTLARIVKETLE
jgi:uncharacterized protein YqeY